jgi:hypothetical protein
VPSGAANKTTHRSAVVFKLHRALLAGIHFEQLFYFYMAFVLLLGICLTYAGFRAAAKG